RSAAHTHCAGRTRFNPGAVPGPVAQEAPSQAPAGQCAVCRPGGFTAGAGRNPAAGDGLGAVRRMGAGSAVRVGGAQEPRHRRSIRAPWPGPHPHALRGAGGAAGPCGARPLLRADQPFELRRSCTTFRAPNTISPNTATAAIVWKTVTERMTSDIGS